MHRAFIIGRYVSRYGGAHKYLENLVQLLCTNGFEVLVGLELHEEIGEFCEVLKHSGAQLANIPFDSKSAIEAAGVLDQIVHEFRPTIIDCEVAAKSVRDTLLLSQQFKRIGCKKLFTMHLAIKSENLPANRLSMLYPFGSWREGLKERRRFLRLFDEALSVSEFHAKRISQLLKLKEGFFTYIPNGVDTNKFSQNNQRENAIPVIGGCGSLVVQKRFDVLLGAAVHLKKNGIKFRIKIAGEGPESVKLQALIAQYELNDVAELAGHQEDVAQFMSELDIFVMCSDNEGFPYAQLEAMASGLPSVVTEVGDFPSMVRDGVEGYLIHRGSSEQLGKALGKLVKDRQLRLKMGQNARQTVIKKYTKEEREAETLAKYVGLSNCMTNIGSI
tara:strand:+ start:146020 stop:147183 length:1164 start_codon:yes stop_codon:yes gene_type:complete